jgi:hypothetical protein
MKTDDADKNKEKTRARKPAAFSENDVTILEEINRFGFMTVREIASITKRHEKVVYSRLKFLCDQEMLKHKQLFWGQPGTYWLTYKGQRLAKSLLTPIKEPRVSTYAHELAVIAVFIEMKARYGEKLTWLTARELMSDKISAAQNYKEAFKQLKNRTPDGIAIFDGRKFAVEVELALKGKSRLTQIVNNYTKSLENHIFDAILYYTNQPRIADRLNETIAAVAGTAAGRFRVGEVKA